MQAGKLRHRLILQRDDGTADASGEVVPSWTTVATLWASIEPIAGREVFEASQAQSRATLRVRIRYYSGLTSKHRFLWGTRILNIDRVINLLGRDAEMEILCYEDE